MKSIRIPDKTSHTVIVSGCAQPRCVVRWRNIIRCLLLASFVGSGQRFHVGFANYEAHKLVISRLERSNLSYGRYGGHLVVPNRSRVSKGNLKPESLIVVYQFLTGARSSLHAARLDSPSWD